MGQARTVTAAVALAGALVFLVQVSSFGVRRVAVAGSLLAVAALVTVSFAGIATFAGADRSWAAGWVTAATGWIWLGPVLAVVLLASAALMARLPDRSVP